VFALKINVENFIKSFGVNSVCMLTITAVGEAAQSMQAFQKQWNSFATGALRDRYAGYVMVMERSAKDRVHAHLLIPIGSHVNGQWAGVDVRTGYDWNAVKCRNYASASSAIKEEWKWLREKVPAYGFGSWVHMEPLKTNALAVSKYVSKYIGKHVSKRLRADQGARLVRYSRARNAATCKFSFVSPSSFLWRRKQSLVAEKLGVSNQSYVVAPYVGAPFSLCTMVGGGLRMPNPRERKVPQELKGRARNQRQRYFAIGGFAACWGPKWAYYSREAFQFLKLASYPTKPHAALDGFDVRDLPDDAQNCVFYSKSAVALEWASADYLREVFRLSKDFTTTSMAAEVWRNDTWGPCVDKPDTGHQSLSQRYQALMRAIRGRDA
jgi:hypothetical protein